MNPGLGEVQFGQGNNLQGFGAESRQSLGGAPLQRSGLQLETGATRPTPAPRGPTAASVAQVAQSPGRGGGRNGIFRTSEPTPVNCGGHKAPSCARCPQGKG